MQLIFEWDEKKARANLEKHKVSFEEAKTLFNDPFLLTYPDSEHSDNEERYISIGYSAHGKTLLVIHTDREESEGETIIRLISCRRATTIERRTYEEAYE
jgi:uncharacterized protein